MHGQDGRHHIFIRLLLNPGRSLEWQTQAAAGARLMLVPISGPTRNFGHFRASACYIPVLLVIAPAVGARCEDPCHLNRPARDALNNLTLSRTQISQMLATYFFDLRA